MKRFRFFVLALTVVSILTVVSAVFAQSFSGVIASGAQYDLYTVDLPANITVVATLVCDPVAPGDRPLDPVLSVFFPGGNPSDTSFADVYNDDGFGTDDDPNGVECNAFDSSRVRFSTPVAGTYTFRADGFGSSTGPYTLTVGADSGNPFTDGRINPQQAAPYALYCDKTTTVVYSAAGQEVFRVENGEEGSSGNARIEIISDGRMMFTAPFPDGKDYIFAYNGCPHGTYEAYTGDPVFASPILFQTGSY